MAALLHRMRVTEPGRDVPVSGGFDVIVRGGGPAGLVALIERHGFMGGAFVRHPAPAGPARAT